ncbi:glutathione S-transferase N-terminal domain-containing protein [Moraxella sp. ZY210820]|uniref:glutathione S-transferase N-terminal domain-containing protein n=1 Tax=unclassified Moraxella TaxID=2685852 RepID=UPI00272FCC11|nr:glutathione S-transferase N-terminal domain-containing protein [Moraxella sp. ZY210820]WLF83521.1 glutathione S-transferase N-terminal domain-containing protein [Moraxella sp. ZY210820]
MPTLYISTTSPYTRMLLTVAEQYQIDLALKFVMPWENPTELTAVNPFSQVPSLLLDNGDVITETPMIMQAIAPQMFDDNREYNLPKIAQALTMTAQGVRAFSIQRFTLEGQEFHPFVARSTDLLKQVLSNLPTLSAESQEIGDKLVLCALIWLSIRLPEVFNTLSTENQNVVKTFEQSELMQKFSTARLEQLLPKTIAEL